ncbi:MAG: UvrABC system protein A [Myxococcota bacterium]|nr:UvrABC system protein A [Myxococcota bacterium]
MSGFISIRGARTHNLKNISVRFPAGELVVITGPSGSGKSSLAFDTLFAAAQRRFIESLSPSARQFIAQLPDPPVDGIEGLRPAVAVSQRRPPAGARATVATQTDIHDFLRVLFARTGDASCYSCGAPLRAWNVAAICDELTALPDGERVILLAPLREHPRSTIRALFDDLARQGFTRAEISGEIFDLGEPPAEALLPEKARVSIVVDRAVIRPGVRARIADSLELALRAANGVAGVLCGGQTRYYSTSPYCAACDIRYPPLEPELFSWFSPMGACPVCGGTGLQSAPPDQESPDNDGAEESAEEAPAAFQSRHCPSCLGARLRIEARHVRVNGRAIHELEGMSLDQFAADMDGWNFPASLEAAAAPLMKELRGRARFLRELELGYLTLDRSARALSGGEIQRLHLATQIGAGLSGVLYVLDEPSIGLHPAGVRRLIQCLLALRDAGNTVVVVEHDLDIIRAAGWVVDMGPGAGKRGGEVLAGAAPAGLEQNPSSVTGPWLSGRKSFPARSGKRKSAGKLIIKGMTGHNLRNAEMAIPLGMCVCVAGVSGAGKSSAVMDTLVPALRARLHGGASTGLPYRSIAGANAVQRVLVVDQSPLGRSPRSCPATVLGIMPLLRELFAGLPDARARGYGANRFSFNVRGGRCENCQGLGVRRVGMVFLPDAWVICEACNGARYNRETLDIRYRGHSIAGILAMSGEEAARLFAPIPGLRERLDMLCAVGLGYLGLGQAAHTLSGGESQRLRIARELGGPGTGRALAVLDEPTTGLHPDDIEPLLNIFEMLTANGHTVLVIEHHLAVAAWCDHLIEFGPEAGPGGGQVIFSGPPAAAASHPESRMGAWLLPFLPLD